MAVHPVTSGSFQILLQDKHSFDVLLNRNTKRFENNWLHLMEGEQNQSVFHRGSSFPKRKSERDGMVISDLSCYQRKKRRTPTKNELFRVLFESSVKTDLS